jgi:hypothetical protein
VNEAAVEVLFEEVLKGFGFYFGGAINGTKRWVLTFLDVDVMVELQVEVGELIGFRFAEDVQEVVIVGGDLRAKVVEFIGSEVIGCCSAKSGVGIRGLDVKDTGLDVIDPCKHSEGCGIHNADRGWTLRHWCRCIESQ